MACNGAKVSRGSCWGFGWALAIDAEDDSVEKETDKEDVKGERIFCRRDMVSAGNGSMSISALRSMTPRASH